MYKRVMLKLSGQALAGHSDAIFDGVSIEYIANEILKLRRNGIQVAAMVGGGNIFRGNVSTNWKIERVEADNVGMLGTIANGVMLRGALEAIADVDPRVMSAIDIPSIGEPYIRRRALSHLEQSQIVLLVGGIGEPFVTTDYPSVQRAIELGCDAVLAAKNGIDGVYTGDPRLDPAARRYERVSYDTAIADNLSFMDQSALVLARQYAMPIHIFDFDTADAALDICRGTERGTYVFSGEDVVSDKTL